MTLTIYLAAVLALLLGYWYTKMKKKYRYWEEKGLKFPSVRPLLGNVKPSLRKEVMGAIHSRIYREFPEERMVGYYVFTQPVLLIRDPVLIQDVLVKNFSDFVDRAIHIDEETNPLEVNLFTMRGNRWRALRNKVSPVFTTGKLRGMTSSMLQAYEIAVSPLKDRELTGYELRDLFITFAIIVNGSCVFGIDTKEMIEPNSEFRKKNGEMFKMGIFGMIKLLTVFSFPKFAKFLGLGFLPGSVIEYFQKIVVRTIQERKDNPYLNRNDLVGTLINLKERGSLDIQSRDDPEDDYLIGEDHQQTIEKFEMTDDVIVSQAITFLSNGFEGVSIVMMYCCMELARNEEIQAKLRREIDEKLKENEDQLDYQAIKEMTYLDQCVQETLRLYPIAQNLTRMPVRKCEIGGIQLDPGIPVTIPTISIHRDPIYYPDPMKFDPDRFAPDRTRFPFTYHPFGEGPRICIGMRFALLEVKIGIISAVRDFELKLNPKTKFPLEFSHTHLVLTPKQKILFNLRKRR